MLLTLTDVFVCPHMTMPQLMISVTGGARDFVLSNQLRDTLRLGLRRTTEVADTWLITGGTNCGVMKVCFLAIER